MNFTNRQIELINFLLKKLNFNEIENANSDKFTTEYFNQLKKSYITFKNLANCEYQKIVYKNVDKNIPKDAIVNFKYKDNGVFFEIVYFSIFNYLQLEVKIKENRLFEIINSQLNYISASDISNFTFCPVSYAISKSMKVRTLTSAKIGLELHESSFVNSIISSKINKGSTSIHNDIDYDDNFKKIKFILSNCEILYNGHSKDGKDIYFKSIKGKFIGQPDFIIRDNSTQKIFVIEEKYHLIPKEFFSRGNDKFYKNLEKENKHKRERDLGFENHKNQVLSYMYGIGDYKIDYGILIYWKYEIEENEKVITKCSYKLIERSEKHQDKLNQIYSNIRRFSNLKKIDFDIDNRNPKKCARCVNNILCGHKTGKFDNITLPYSLNFLAVNKTEFPVSLIKEGEKTDNRSYFDKIVDNIEPDESEFTEIDA